MIGELQALDRLHELALLPQEGDRLEPLLAEVLDAAIEVSGADSGQVQLLDPVSLDLRIAVQRGLPSWWADVWNEAARGQGRSAPAGALRARLVVEDVTTSPLFAGRAALDAQLKAGVRAMQSTPLLTRGGQAVGVLSTHFGQPHRPDERTLQWLDLVARQAADVILHAQAWAARRESEQRLRALVLSSWDVVYGMSPDWSRLLFLEGKGIVPDSPQVRDDWLALYIDAPDRPAVQAAIQQAVRTAGVFELEQRVRRSDGTPGWLHARAVPVHGPDGHVVEWFGVARDVTDARRAKAELSNERQRLHALLEALPVGVAFTDSPGCERVIGNATLLRQLCAGRGDNVSATAPEADAPGRQVVYRQGGQDVPGEQLPLQRAACEGRAIPPVELEVRLPNGKVFFMEAAAAPIRDAQGSLIGAVAVTSDITERGRATEARERARLAQAMAEELEHRVAQRTRELHRLAGDLEAAESRERRQIARDLHDDLGQLLAAARIRLAPLCADARDDVRQAALAIAELVELADRSTRSLAAQLAPAALYELGLSAALEWLAGEIGRRFGLRVEVHCDGDEPPLSPVVRSIVYRASRELLLNAAKHAGADHARVDLRREGEQLVVTVTDGGAGFAQAPGPPGARRRGGLASVQERLSYIGGSFDLHTEPGLGTQVRLRVPLEEASPGT